MLHPYTVRALNRALLKRVAAEYGVTPWGLYNLLTGLADNEEFKDLGLTREVLLRMYGRTIPVH